ncbi:MAG: Gfo/Idh/MocA family oxidoreductase [Nocardioides sp.]
MAQMRVGLVGTGPWAELAHGPGLVAAPSVDLVGVWGRSLERAEALAERLGVTAYDDYAALLADVEAVAFAVPPAVQGEMALLAARAGRHLLLDKPVAIDVGAARLLRDTAAGAGLASVVFFTDRFVDETRAWIAEVHDDEGWRGGWVRWFSALQEPDNPFGASPWRHEAGALWDTGPHALSIMMATLGPITSLTAVAGAGDEVHLVVRHGTGQTSSITLSQFAPPAAAIHETTLWGDAGLTTMPPIPDGAIVALLARAAEELVHSAATGEPHELDLHFGTRVVELLAMAQDQLR